MMERYKWQLEVAAREFAIRIRHYVVNGQIIPLPAISIPEEEDVKVKFRNAARRDISIILLIYSYPRRGTNMGQCRDAARKYWLLRRMRLYLLRRSLLFLEYNIPGCKFDALEKFWGIFFYLDNDLQFCYPR